MPNYHTSKVLWRCGGKSGGKGGDGGLRTLSEKLMYYVKCEKKGRPRRGKPGGGSEKSNGVIRGGYRKNKTARENGKEGERIPETRTEFG